MAVRKLNPVTPGAKTQDYWHVRHNYFDCAREVACVRLQQNRRTQQSGKDDDALHRWRTQEKVQSN